jgi:predicted amidohydrolase YtcJ
MVGPFMHRFLIAALFLPGMASFVATAQPQLLLIEAGRVLDPVRGAYRAQQGILIENGRIRELGDLAAVREHAPKDAVVIDLRSATVLPGLIDCHAHLLAGVALRPPGEALTLTVAQMSPSQRALLGARNGAQPGP